MNIIKRTLSFILSVVLIMGAMALPGKAQAADTGSKAGAVSTSSGRLNVRSSGSTSSSVLTSLKSGSYVTLMSKSGSWWRVEYGDDKYGYCHADYITPVSGSAATVKTSSGNLNVRSGAGSSYSRIGSLPKGEVVIVLSTSGGWSRILYHGTKTGYVSAQYLSASSSSSSSSSSSAVYPAAAMKIPDFKQTDSRWANVTLGSSGKTIARVGCATTAVAMMESYRTGTTIYPDAMSRKLKYTSSGNLYWPSHYTPVTSSSNYLKVLYQKIREGKPVLFGAKNSYGTQHWVVITGFTGGNILTAAGFAINDPGSSSRKNLQHFLNEYPNFYKYFYY